jgi:hypothetical protein
MKTWKSALALCAILSVTVFAACGDDSGTTEPDMSAVGTGCSTIATCVLACGANGTCIMGCVAKGSSEAVTKYNAIQTCGLNACMTASDAGAAKCMSATDASSTCVTCATAAAQSATCSSQLSACLADK